MPGPVPPDEFGSFRQEARLLAEQFRSQEQALDSAVAEAEADIRYSEFELAQPLTVTPWCVDRLGTALRTQWLRSIDRLALTRQLCTAARAQHVVADRLLAASSDALPPDAALMRGQNAHAVLVVDDYADIREVVAIVLENAGFVVRTARNGLEGLIAAYEMRPAVIVMDIAMPILDGLEATRLIKATEATKAVRVIAHTATNTIDDNPARRLFAAVLRKPSHPDAVVAAVRECVRA